ncbi:lysosomal Pro-X carboxypeptidase-like protein [Dinothrombium tinctorium]|uniref:Lysosomal Pro-X carboxypeptidase n=1 Tax=Dinothrombium tinctorium TaxID=1965070 RepID=A0A3S3NUE6_9ACAR|nr:lysosomal Pro-X carboxypeptidase-like protein [Dinothrombium tinctorium]
MKRVQLDFFNSTQLTDNRPTFISPATVAFILPSTSTPKAPDDDGSTTSPPDTMSPMKSNEMDTFDDILWKEMLGNPRLSAKLGDDQLDSNEPSASLNFDFESTSGEEKDQKPPSLSNFIKFLKRLLNLPDVTEDEAKNGLKIVTPIPANFSVFYYEQKVDHFSYTNNDTFDQRVIISADHWCKNGCPIFFFTGGASDIFTYANNSGLLWENAARFRAMVIFAEHRYFGHSLPYGKRAFKNLKTLGYLNVEQSLADFAEIIQDIKQSYPAASRSPVIAFGGSYGANLAAWLRIKYPHLVEGALASSAMFVTDNYDCGEYYRIVTKNFERYSTKCSESIRKSWTAIRNLWKVEEGRNWLSDTFRLCRQLKEADISDFMNWLTTTFTYLAMVDYPNAANLFSPLPANPINETCQHLDNPNHTDKTLLRRVFKAISIFHNYTKERRCIEIKKSVEVFESDPWSFMSCTEIIIPKCSDGINDMFFEKTWNLTKIKTDCMNRWKIIPRAQKIQLLFGGRNLSAASNIVFSVGERDPMAAYGLLNSISLSLVVIKIPNAYHIEDLRPSDPHDSLSLLDARRTEVQIIKYWINTFYSRIGFYPRHWLEFSNLI